MPGILGGDHESGSAGMSSVPVPYFRKYSLQTIMVEFGVSNLPVATASISVMGWGERARTRMANGQWLLPHTFASVTTLQEQSSLCPLAFPVLFCSWLHTHPISSVEPVAPVT